MVISEHLTDETSVWIEPQPKPPKQIVEIKPVFEADGSKSKYYVQLIPKTDDPNLRFLILGKIKGIVEALRTTPIEVYDSSEPKRIVFGWMISKETCTICYMAFIGSGLKLEFVK